jgi:hypothetical protein
LFSVGFLRVALIPENKFLTEGCAPLPPFEDIPIAAPF